VTISVTKEEENVKLTVHNEGHPIPTDKLGIIFEQYRRLEKAKQKPGWGIGLLVAKGIVEAHGGTIRVESSAEKGTNFIVTIPLRAEINKAA
jgi:signal transduction histidine kinase